jgi:ribonuclease T1
MLVMRTSIFSFFLASFLTLVGFSTDLSAKETRSAIAEIKLDQLPVEAQRTLKLVKQGGPFPYKKDGTTFSNRERILPRQPRGYYSEYTVKTPKTKDRGPIRIVAGGDPKSSGEYYFTDDHYASFKRIRE